MSYAHVQSLNDGGGPTIIGTFTAGNKVCIAVQSSADPGTVTVVSSQLDTITSGPQSIVVAATNCWLSVFYISSAVGGLTTLSFSSSTSAGLYNKTADEYSGLGAFVNSASNTASAGPGSNALTSGNINFTSAPGMIWAVTSDPGFSTLPTAGTSPIAYTGRATLNDLLTEDGPVAATGNSQATFGITTGDQCPVVALGFLVASGTAYTLACAYGAYAETGEAVSFTIGASSYLLIANAGAYDIVGSPAYSDFGLSSAYGSYVLIGGSINLGVISGFSAGAYAIAGGSVTFSKTSPTPLAFGLPGGPGHLFTTYATGMIYTRYN